MKELLNRAIRWTLAAIGVGTAASCDGHIWGAVEYGTPHCDFEVKCKVMDAESGKAVKGIKLSPGYAYKYTDQDGERVEGFEPYSDAVQTADGVFEMKGVIHAGHGEFDELHIRLTDPDPTADGHYKDSIYVVSLKKIRDAEKGNHWNTGTYGADVTIEAELVKDK